MSRLVLFVTCCFVVTFDGSVGQTTEIRDLQKQLNDAIKRHAEMQAQNATTTSSDSPSLKPSVVSANEKPGRIGNWFKKKWASLKSIVIWYNVDWDCTNPEFVKVTIWKEDKWIPPGAYFSKEGSSDESFATRFKRFANRNGDKHLINFAEIMGHFADTGDLNLWKLFQLVRGHPLTSQFLELPMGFSTDLEQVVTNSNPENVANKLRNTADFIESVQKRIKAISYWTLLKILSGRMSIAQILRAIADLLDPPKPSK